MKIRFSTIFLIYFLIVALVTVVACSVVLTLKLNLYIFYIILVSKSTNMAKSEAGGTLV